jgi:hypothetical protein
MKTALKLLSPPCISPRRILANHVLHQWVKLCGIGSRQICNRGRTWVHSAMVRLGNRGHGSRRIVAVQILHNEVTRSFSYVGGV